MTIVRHLCLVFGSTLLAASVSMAQDNLPDQIDYSMFFDADIRDSAECNVTLVDGQFHYGEKVRNPSATCPDAFSWYLFTRIIQEEWWEAWSTDRQTFPSDPWPRCESGQSDNCCPAVQETNEVWPEHCPVFPGLTPGKPVHVLEPPSKAHQVALSSVATSDTNQNGVQDFEDVPASLKNAVIGAVQNELIYRNRPMVDYIFDRNLYSIDGLAAVYANFVEAIGTYAPRWPRQINATSTNSDIPKTVNIEFPLDSIMIKINWMAVDIAREYGIDPDDVDNPYIVANLVPLADTTTPPKTAPVETKPFVLLSMHIASAELPNWIWSTFEHVDNIGRCDWIGCNDSFGYPNTQTLTADTNSTDLAEPAHNFTPPHKVTQVDGANVVAFRLNDRYGTVDQISESLDAIFKGLGIGTGSSSEQSGDITKEDPAWRSYRLKGSQIDFTTRTGRNTRLGNSVTEAGFVNSASCITCHSRAATTKEGVPPLSIFVDWLSADGIPKGKVGMPNEAWFNINGYWGVNDQREAPTILSVPTHFVYGFRMACPIKPMSYGNPWCANVHKNQ